ncbi:MAG TPA: hypothetical protein VI937_03430 [Negativicutes bacterium]|nr:hypothetical protein [Negativicutes bacterium]
METKKLPFFLKEYFWDIDFNDLDFKKSKVFVLKRILDKGNDKALLWIRQHYTNQEIKKLLLNTRDISPKTANFWADYLKINHKKVPCLQKPYTRIPFGLSS